MWRTLSVHSSFSLKRIYSAQFCICHRGQKVLWRFASFMNMQTWDKLSLNCVSFLLPLLDLSTWHLVSLLSTFPRSYSHNCPCVSFSLTKGETWSPGRKKDQRNEQKSVSCCPRSVDDVLVASDNSELPLKVDLVIWHCHSWPGWHSPEMVVQEKRQQRDAAKQHLWFFKTFLRNAAIVDVVTLYFTGPTVS